MPNDSDTEVEVVATVSADEARHARLEEAKRTGRYIDLTAPAVPPFDPPAKAAHLRTNSYVLIDMGEELTTAWRNGLIDWVANAPEFLPAKRAVAMDQSAPGMDRLMGVGGFGAPGVASLPNWYKLRSVGRVAIEQVYKQLEPHLGCPHLPWMQGLPDRIVWRPAGVKPTKEKGHRDLSPSDPRSVAFGMMINLTEHTLHFSCVPGTHLLHSKAGCGFTSLSPEDNHRLATEKVKVPIKPHQAFVFYESMIHEVLGGALPFDKMCAFVGFQLCAEPQVMHPGGRQRMIDQLPHNYKAYLPGRDAARPRMWPRIYPVFSKHRDRLTKFASEMRPDMSEECTIQSGANAGHTYRRPKEYAPSLKELGCPQPEWTQAELDVYNVCPRTARRGTKRPFAAHTTTAKKNMKAASATTPASVVAQPTAQSVSHMA